MVAVNAPATVVIIETYVINTALADPMGSISFNTYIFSGNGTADFHVRVSSPQPRRCGSDRRRARRAAPRDPGGDVARRDGAFSRAVDGTNISRSGR